MKLLPFVGQASYTLTVLFRLLNLPPVLTIFRHSFGIQVQLVPVLYAKSSLLSQLPATAEASASMPTRPCDSSSQRPLRRGEPALS
jgi:hypothetical protein